MIGKGIGHIYENSVRQSPLIDQDRSSTIIVLPTIEQEHDDDQERNESCRQWQQMEQRSMDCSPTITSKEPFSLPHKAERILGVWPGTLAHAKACLDNALDVTRRLSDNSGTTKVNVRPKMGMGKAGELLMAGIEHAKSPNVHLDIVPKTDLTVLERRQRAADGVLFWQREVARLETKERSLSLETGNHRS